MQLNEVSGAGLVQSTSDTTLPLCWRANFRVRYGKQIQIYLFILVHHL